MESDQQQMNDTSMNSKNSFWTGDITFANETASCNSSFGMDNNLMWETLDSDVTSDMTNESS